MNIKKILQQLNAERRRIDEAIAALQALQASRKTGRNRAASRLSLRDVPATHGRSSKRARENSQLAQTMVDQPEVRVIPFRKTGSLHP